MSGQPPGSEARKRPPSLRLVWVTLAVAAGLAGALFLFEIDPQDWFPYGWEVLPVSYDAWGRVLAWSITALLVVLLAPIVLGVRAMRAGLDAALLPTALASIIFCAWAFFAVAGWVMYIAIGQY